MLLTLKVANSVVVNLFVWEAPVDYIYTLRVLPAVLCFKIDINSIHSQLIL